VAIDDLDVEVRDLAAGRPLEVLLRAAVLAEKQNLELRLGAAPLPPSLVPTPVTLVLKAQPIDLAPLAPFLPATAGFLGGRFEADLDAALGAAVPGGAGPTKIRGGFKATSLRFRDQTGGRPLDVVLDSDLEANVGAGDLRIAKLQLDAGPARITGKGRVAGFTGASPRVEGLELVGSGLDPEALAAYYPPLREQVGGRVAGPRRPPPRRPARRSSPTPARGRAAPTARSRSRPTWTRAAWTSAPAAASRRSPATRSRRGSPAPTGRPGPSSASSSRASTPTSWATA
jgi:hypothetical protein